MKYFDNTQHQLLWPDWNIQATIPKKRLWQAVSLSLRIDVTRFATREYRARGKAFAAQVDARLRFGRNALVTSADQTGILHYPDDPGAGPGPFGAMVDMRSFAERFESAGLWLPDEFREIWLQREATGVPVTILPTTAIAIRTSNAAASNKVASVRRMFLAAIEHYEPDRLKTREAFMDLEKALVQAVSKVGLKLDPATARTHLAEAYDFIAPTE